MKSDLLLIISSDDPATFTAYSKKTKVTWQNMIEALQIISEVRVKITWPGQRSETNATSQIPKQVFSYEILHNQFRTCYRTRESNGSSK